MNKVIITINLTNRGSTGNIINSIAEEAKKQGFTTYQAYPGRQSNIEKKLNDLIIIPMAARVISQRICRWSGFLDMGSLIYTRFFIEKLKKIKPGIIHIHNIHGSFLNIPMLFKYLKTTDVKIIWTLHDCWAFTGRCPHFQISNCEKWKTGCFQCEYPSKDYPASCIDRSEFLWKKKRDSFSGFSNLEIVTPSQWLADLTKQSFLGNYPIKVINNGIDLSVFKPAQSDFRRKYDIRDDQYMLLGVAFSWGMRKGLDVFIELSKQLDVDKYKIVLVGTDEVIDKELPGCIISIHRTQNQKELAEIYTAADVFVNPTREEVLGMVNIEALACGTPVITFNTGGSPECINEYSGCVVKCDEIEALADRIVQICTEKVYKKSYCINRAKLFDKKMKFIEYVEMYNQIIDK